MWNDNYTYAALLFGSILFPFLFSFEKNIRFIRFLKPVLFAILFPGVFFIVWDALFTYLGFWSFSPLYTLGPRLWGLPVEEWLFFVVIPYCSLFVYEVLRYYLPRLEFHKTVGLFLTVIAALLLVLGISAYGVWYTFVCLTSASLFLFILLSQKDIRNYRSHFLLAFGVSCIPMFTVNGVLTALPVVEYNSAFFSGYRISTIPAEDFAYFLLLFSMNFVVYQKVKKRNCCFGHEPKQQ